MKTQSAFTLPIPPLGLHIIRCCRRDVDAATARIVKDLKSPWIFTSRVLQSDAGIIPASGSGLANHIRNMRGQRAKHGGNHRDILKGIRHSACTLSDPRWEILSLMKRISSQAWPRLSSPMKLRRPQVRNGPRWRYGKALVLPGAAHSRKDPRNGAMVESPSKGFR